MPKKVFIYCLKDPTTGDVRYIGKTENFKKRLKDHLKYSSKLKSRLGNWLRSLKEGKPVLVVLHEVTKKELWQEEERRYISCARALGIDLVNTSDGGDGNSGPLPPKHRAAAIKQCAAMNAAKKGVPLSPETRAAMSAAWTPERRAAMSAAKTGVRMGPPSPETRAKISKTMTGVPLSPERCAARRGVPHSSEHRAAQSAALKGVSWSPARRAAYERRWGVK